MNKQKYYTKNELIEGIDGLPKFTEGTLKKARKSRKMQYTKVGRDCVYKRDWVLKYLESNEVTKNEQ